MRIVNRQGGFTLIELLIVVAILGILAAVIIPNVGRFLGSGEKEARNTEYQNVITAVGAMMVDNSISAIPNLLGTASTDCTSVTESASYSKASNLMNSWPDTTSVGGSADKKSDPDGTDYTASDGSGYLLFAHDIKSDSGTTTLVNYMTVNKSSFCYATAADGTIEQFKKDGTKTNP